MDDEEDEDGDEASGGTGAGAANAGSDRTSGEVGSSIPVACASCAIDRNHNERDCASCERASASADCAVRRSRIEPTPDL